MAFVPFDLSSVISGIIALGANGGETLFLPDVHAVLCKMKSHERMLSGLWFSITGSVCYSRDIDYVIRELAVLGVLRMEGGSTAVVKNVRVLRGHLRRMLPLGQYRRILAASLKFYERLGR